MTVKHLVWNDDNRKLEKNNMILLSNAYNGLWTKITKECYDIICELIDAHITYDYISEIDGCFANREDQEYIENLIKSMMDAKLLVDSNYNKKKFTAPNISTLSLIVTNRCNLSCFHCCQDASNMDGKDILQTKDIFRIIDIISKLSVEGITITGGEPLLRKDINNIIQYLKNNYKGKLDLLTNGLLIDERNIDLITSSFDSISISLDGYNEELTEMVRGKNVFQEIVKKIKMLKDFGFDNISVSAILPPSDEVEKNFEQLCKSLDVGHEIRSFSVSGRGSTNYLKLKNNFDKYISKNNFNKYDSLERESIGNLSVCNAGLSSITIDAKGDIYPCNLLQEDEFLLGNILENNNILSEYTNSNGFGELQNLRFFKNTPCESCDISSFCWFCLSELNEYLAGRKKFEDRCDIRKRTIDRMIWGD